MEQRYDKEYLKLLDNDSSLDEYVCFMDILGVKHMLTHDIKRAAIFVLRFHEMILKVKDDSKLSSIHVYPVMDGAFITTPCKNDMLKFLSEFYKLLCMYDVERDVKDRFLVRSAVAFGQIIHGCNLPHNIITDRLPHCIEGFVFGAPIAFANQNEYRTSPLGIYIHHTACNKEDGIDRNWRWYENSNSNVDYNEKCLKMLKEYYCELANNDKCKDKDYEPDKREKHFERIMKYFEG